MGWLWFVLAGLVALANLGLGVLLVVGTDAERRGPLHQALRGLGVFGLWLSLAEVWVHASGAASWHSWPLMWVAPVATVLQAPFSVGGGVPRRRSASVLLGLGLAFSVPPLLMVAAGRAPLD